jgi:glyoxylase-like metal-dependent hydrolase (beta-lactamase superfamily II)
MTSNDLPEGIERVELPGWSEHGEAAKPTSVYLLRGDAPALVGAGHPTQSDALIAALDELGVPASSIRRIVVGSWSPAVLGGVVSFPRADWFVATPDMIAPRHYDTWLDEERATFVGLVDEILERSGEWSREALDGWLERAFPRVTDHLDFVPVRTGQTVQAGSFELEVVSAPGPNPGHSVLWNATHRLAFTGDLQMRGLPAHVESARDYLVALERTMDLEPQWMLPTHGEPTPYARRRLKSMLQFCNNFLSNVAMTLAGGKSVLEFVDADLGYRPETLVEYAEEVRRRRPFLEELAASGMVETSGDGLDKRYGTDVEAPYQLELS